MLSICLAPLSACFFFVVVQQHALIDLCKNEASKFLVKGQYEFAIPGALQSLRFSIDVYGQGRIELVPAYLLLAEANLGAWPFSEPNLCACTCVLTFANAAALSICGDYCASQVYRGSNWRKSFYHWPIGTC